MKIYIRAASRYVRAYWFDDDQPSIDDFIYEPNNRSNTEPEDLPIEITDDDPYDDSVGYDDIDEYELYGYSEYDEFYDQIKKRKIYVPLRVAKDIPDYNAYRKALFGTLYLSLKSGESIEILYNEFSTAFPSIVKGDYVNESDMLLELVDAVLYAQSIVNPRP